MKKFKKETGHIMGNISIIMLFIAIIFIFFIFSKWGWWFDVAVFSPIMSKLNIPYTIWFWFLRIYLIVMFVLAIFSAYFSEKD